MSPSKPLRPCVHPGCRALTRGGRCAAHQVEAWHKSQGSGRVILGRTLQRERERLFNSQPLCVECLKAGRDTPATIRDHVVPLAEGGQDVSENTQGLCQECSDAKTEAERKRGLRRARG